MNQYDLAIPMLPSRSIEKTAIFYRAMGFEGGPHGHDSNYGIFRRGSIELHFFTHRDLKPEEAWAGCYIRVLDVKPMYEAVLAADLPSKGIPRADKLEDKPWGLREFAVVDPDGNLLRIGQVI